MGSRTGRPSASDSAVSDRESGFPPSKECARCRGDCCKNLPGGAHPVLDFGLPQTQQLRAALRGGKYAIDWFEGDPRAGKSDLSEGYYVRAAVKDAERLFDPSFGGECVFLTETGCELKFNQRPWMCRMLEPKPNGGKCVQHGGSKREDALRWLPYRAILLRVGRAEESRCGKEPKCPS